MIWKANSTMMVMTVKGAPVNQVVRRRNTTQQCHLGGWKEMQMMVSHLERGATKMKRWRIVKEKRENVKEL